jgi:NADH-quinone oxidoreductase subunit E
MLSEEEKKEIDYERSCYPELRAAGIEALQVIQKHRRWVSDEAMQEVSDYIGLPLADLEAVATFYNVIYRQPVGRHIIMVCDSVSCWIRNYEGLHELIKNKVGIEFGQTTADDRFTLLPIVCIGACNMAPAFMVDDTLYGDIDPAAEDAGERLDEILENYP